MTPSLRTLDDDVGLAPRPSTVRGVPGVPWWRAFATRLENSCRSRSGSPAEVGVPLGLTPTSRSRRRPELLGGAGDQVGDVEGAVRPREPRPPPAVRASGRGAARSCPASVGPETASAAAYARHAPRGMAFEELDAVRMAPRGCAGRGPGSPRTSRSSAGRRASSICCRWSSKNTSALLAGRAARWLEEEVDRPRLVSLEHALRVARARGQEDDRHVLRPSAPRSAPPAKPFISGIWTSRKASATSWTSSSSSASGRGAGVEHCRPSRRRRPRSPRGSRRCRRRPGTWWGRAQWASLMAPVPADSPARIPAGRWRGREDPVRGEAVARAASGIVPTRGLRRLHDRGAPALDRAGGPAPSAFAPVRITPQPPAVGVGGRLEDTSMAGRETVTGASIDSAKVRPVSMSR